MDGNGGNRELTFSVVSGAGRSELTTLLLHGCEAFGLILLHWTHLWMMGLVFRSQNLVGNGR